MPDKLDLSHFKIRQAILEFRYSTAYLLWDRAGLIWNKISSELHNLKMIKAEPATTTFISDNRYELSVKLDKSHFTDMKPCSGLKDFFKYSESFFSLVTNTLGISEFTRLGFRLVYVKNFPDKVSAAKSVLSTNKLQVPGGK
ncbi:MAG: hypothetical protein GY730_11405, partial [bacterium]|nr:hypothetical protein [bacterium]